MPTALLLSLALAAPQNASPAQTERPPNVVVILADDLGAGELGSYGQALIRTPNLDRLAAEGMRFTRAYSGSPVCAPSRCVLLTGKHTGHAEVRDNWENGGWGADEPEGQHPLSPEEVTIAELLKARGYRTACGGKWGLGGPETHGHPNAQGFDHFIGYLCQRKAHNYYPTHLWRNGDMLVLEGNGEYYRAHQKIAGPLASDDEYYERYNREQYAPQVIADDLLDWVRSNAGEDVEEPFFLYYPTVIPHLALQVPREEVEAYPAEWDDAPYLGGSYLPHPSPRRGYAAMITHMDRQIGRLLDLLDELGVADDTLVIFTSDNGASWVGGVDAEFFGSHDGRRGRKAQLWEGGIRVPMIARWPGRITAGTVTDHLCAFQDMLPTIVEAAGGDAPPHRASGGDIDGLSFLPTLTGRGEQAQHDGLYFEFRPFDGQVYRTDRWKLVRRGLKKGPARVELYDLANDPAEAKNVAANHPEVVAALTEAARASRAPSELFPFPWLDARATDDGE